MVQEHHRRAFGADVFNFILDCDLVFQLRARDGARHQKLFRKDLRMAHGRLDPDLFLIHIPQDMLCRDIVNCAVQRQLLSLVGTWRADSQQTARGQKARCKVLEPSGLLVIVIGRVNVAVDREKAAVLAMQAQSCDICAAVRRNGKFQPQAVFHLQKPHAVALAAGQPVFLHTEQLRLMAVICAFVHLNTP